MSSNNYNTVGIVTLFYHLLLTIYIMFKIILTILVEWYFNFNFCVIHFVLSFC